MRKIYARTDRGIEGWLISFGEYRLEDADHDYFHVRAASGRRWRMNITSGEGTKYYEIFPSQEEIDFFIMLYPASEARWQAKSFEEIIPHSG